jgi:hypothetical protein
MKMGRCERRGLWPLVARHDFREISESISWDAMQQTNLGNRDKNSACVQSSGAEGGVT